MELAGSFRYSESIVAVLRVDDGVFVDVNPAFERITGYRRDETIGRLPIDLGIWRSHDVRALIWGLLRTERRLVSLPIEFLARDGRMFRGRLSCEMFEHEGCAHALAMMQDIVASDAPEPASAMDYGSYRALFMAAAEGLYRSFPEGGFIDVNPAMARIFGYESPAQMLSEIRMRASVLYVDQEHGRRLVEELNARGRIEQVRSQVRRRGGSTIWISENARKVTDASGRILFYEGSVVDITEQLAAEAALRESEALYKVLVDNCRDGVFLVQRGNVKFANRALADMLGYDIPELVGTEYMQLVAPEDRAAQGERRSAREGGSRAVQAYEVNLVRKDGRRALFAVHADAVYYRGDIASTGVMRDVTEERRQQRALEEAERKYRELFQNSVTGLFQTHPDGRVLEANRMLAELLGYESPEALKAEITDLRSVYVDPDDRARLTGLLMRQGRFERQQAQFRRRDGRAIWVEANAHVVFAHDGTVAYFEGSLQDVTARREAERALQSSEAKYRTLVEHSQVGVFIRREDRYVYVNHAFAAMLDYREEELVGKSYRELVAPDYLAASEARDRQRSGGALVSVDYETCLLRRDGARVYVTVSTGPVAIDGVPHLTGTVRDVTRHRQAEQRLKFHATHDPLTGLPNRLHFQQRLLHVIAERRKTGQPDYAVLFLDLDGFKVVNDSLGHAAGDRLLVVIAERLAKTLNGQALVARYGGDEFTILPQGACDTERAIALARRVLQLFEGSFDIGGNRVFSGASLGIVIGRSEYRSPDQVLRDADTAMYRAKASGKSGFVVFDEAMHNAARRRFQVETDLRLALRRDEFRVYFQPIVELTGGHIVGCESLLRWQHPEHGLLVPAQFLHVAEEAGLIAEIDWWVLEQTCRNLRGWQQNHAAHRSLKANVNVDERQLGDPNLTRTLSAILERTGVDASSIALEVTETIFRRGRGDVIDTLNALKRIGLTLVVDDFGTGYSSLDSFAASPFDALKVDRSFVHDMETNRRHRAIVRTITSFAEDLGLSLTAEGVETEGQVRLLAEMGCVTAQGYLYARPMPADQLDALLAAPRCAAQA
jgi:diguanylate cyclase (GGDEF)-like protein/PAS domain S-box-containing protein